MEDENAVNTVQPKSIHRSRIPQSSGLNEMNQSSTNARSGLLPPGTIAASVANKSSGISQPTKTKTASQQPAEPKKSGLAASTNSRPASGAAKPHGRANSVASSVSSRTTSTSSRTSSNGSSSATVGPGARPPSVLGNPRAQTSQSGLRKPGALSVPRPKTSLDTHEEELSGSVLGKRKGMHKSSLPCLHVPPSILGPALRGGQYDKYMNYTSDWSSDRAALPVPGASVAACRDSSLCTALRNLTLNPTPDPSQNPIPSSTSHNEHPGTPHSKLPKPLNPARPPALVTPLPSPSKRKSTKKRPPEIVPFLTKDSNIKAWDHESRVREFEQMAESFFARMSQAGHESYGLKETVELYKSRVSELEATQKELRETNVALRVEIETMKNRVAAAENALKDTQREHEIAVDEFDRRQRVEAENIRQEGKKELEALRSRHEEEIRELTRASEEEMRELKRRYESELEDERAARHREINQLASERALDSQRTRIELENKDREISRLQADLQALRDDLEQERAKNRDLRQNLDTASSNSVTLESTIRALKARIEFLESDSQEQSQAFERLNQQLMDALAETNAAKEKLRREETLRRKLHNQVQELKGNIRVFCRVRPTLPHEASEAAQIQFPDESSDCKEISVLGPEERSSLGNVTRKNHVFSFDRVFGPNTNNADVFEEISQLVQSALDGYNVCIFCYGQTGSGKTYTMSSEDGMIPRAVHQIYDTAKNLEEKGWKYTMEGNFVEVYNENLNDLLGKAEEFDKKKHEIRHDMQRCRTTITDVTTVTLDSPQTVESILRRAAANRSVAATKANERSSRSHSVFILRLIGENSITGERSEGTLNLVDLAGSERLSHSGATGERLKETQNINRSLACLGDVISALGQGKEGGHIPYRNSKLTYLLQFSLGGNSKTLMFVMVSPLQAHLGETLTSLKFATKVHNTHIGTAKRQARIRDS